MAQESTQQSSAQQSSTKTPDIQLFFLQAHSPIHVGVGEGVGHLNLPTARESVTQYPYVPGTSIKGVLREQAEIKYPENNEFRYGQDPVVQIFGPPTDRAGDARGGVVFSDARLLFLPLRSLIGGFALVTCPLILSRFQRELKLTGRLTGNLKPVLSQLTQRVQEAHALIPDKDSCLIDTSAPSTAAKAGSGSPGTPSTHSVLIEDIRFDGQLSPFVAALAAQLTTLGVWDSADADVYTPRLAIVSDTQFGFFAESSLEIRHRVKIDDQTGTAAASGPWTEEYIPAESLFFGMVQGRKTVLVHEVGKDGAEKQDSIKVDAPANLLALKGLVGNEVFLRFGGKSSGGAGRAFFRLV